MREARSLISTPHNFLKEKKLLIEAVQALYKIKPHELKSVGVKSFKRRAD